MQGLGLNAEQRAARRLRLHAGDAAELAEGRWRALWRRKKGDAEDDLSDSFRMQLGSMTEPFNLAWTQEATGRRIRYHSANPLMLRIWRALTGKEGAEEETAISSEYEWMACNLDGMTTTPKGRWCPIDAKHVGRADDPMVLRYTAAGTWQATVMECEWWALSLIVGNRWVPPIYQPVDPIYRDDLIERGREFWRFIEKDEEPPDQGGELPPKPVPRLRRIVVPEGEDALDALVRQNNWLPAALRELRAFIETKPAADRNQMARRAVAETLPADVGLLEYGLISAKRDGRGLTISFKREDGQ